MIAIPLVLETPIDLCDDDGNPIKDEKGKQKEDESIWATEIKLLESLVGMDTESDEFVTLASKLARKGKPERQRLTDQIERKKAQCHSESHHLISEFGMVIGWYLDDCLYNALTPLGD